MVRFEVENGKFYLVINVSERTSVLKEITRDEAMKLIQQIKSGLINTPEGE